MILQLSPTFYIIVHVFHQNKIIYLFNYIYFFHLLWIDQVWQFQKNASNEFLKSIKDGRLPPRTHRKCFECKKQQSAAMKSKSNIIKPSPVLASMKVEQLEWEETQNVSSV